jgi:hypothetical protein
MMKEAFEKVTDRLVKKIKPLHNANWNAAFEEAIEIVNQVAEEYNKEHNKEYNKKHNTDAPGRNVGSNDGWIACSERLPEEKENPVTRDWCVYPVMVNFADIIDIRYYCFGNGHWHHGPSIMDRYVTHWMDIAPFKPKGE